jgi:hypothetical protein
MNAVLLWKEYRQQRAIWLTVLLLAAILALTLSATLPIGKLTDFDLNNVNEITFSLLIIAVAYGIIVGAFAMAGEKEDGTLDFLDGLTGRRSPVWRRKVAASVVLVLSQCLAFTVVDIIFGFADSEIALIMLAAGLHGMAWGLLAGALCRTVLIAFLAGIAFVIGCWALSIFLAAIGLPILGWPAGVEERDVLSILVAVGLVLAAVYASWRIFCRDDISRRQPARRAPSLVKEGAP